MKWPDYDKEPLEIWNDPVYEVFDPWKAQIVGLFYNLEDAEFFAKAYVKRAKKQKGD